MLWIALLAAQSGNLDAVAAAPANHRVVLDDDTVRVLRVEVAPGATEPVHVHRWPSLMYFERPQPITYIAYAPAGSGLREVRRFDAPAFAAGQVMRVPPEGPHAITNRGDAPFVAIRVEFKTPPGADAAPAKPDPN